MSKLVKPLSDGVVIVQQKKKCFVGVDVRRLWSCHIDRYLNGKKMIVLKTGAI